VSGHAEEAWRPVLAGLSPATITVVVLMGLASRDAIATALVSRGWAPSTPAAILWGAGTPAFARWIGPLADLGQAETPPAAKGAAGTIVVGAVVGLANVLGGASSSEWDEEGPAAVAAGVEGGRHAR
jgi:siroheme synthase